MQCQEQVKKVTLKNNISTLRVFLKWCEEIQAVERGIHDLVSLSDDEITSDAQSDLEELNAILDYLETYEFATRRHATFQLMWHTCIRMGTVQALDLNDYDPENGLLTVRHRPETGTPTRRGPSSVVYFT